MAKITAFLFQSLDGFYKDENDAIAWHQHGEEASAFSEQHLAQDTILLFGRRTFEMMQAFWPSAAAAQAYPRVAAAMNVAEKWVVSSSLNETNWQHSEILSLNAIEEIKKRKLNASKNITVLGSANLVRQLKEADLLDNIQIWIDPIALGTGSTIFEGADEFINFKLDGLQTFEVSGAILLHYQII